ncbi:MAG: putative Ig domain-containing protein, partial [Planctomycetota bacterium]|nr:putative Ig domain-containing protein [Planctomycetota bacterium]
LISKSGAAASFFAPGYGAYHLESQYSGGIVLGEDFTESKAVYEFYLPGNEGTERLISSITVRIFGSGDITTLIVGATIIGRVSGNWSRTFNGAEVDTALGHAGDQVKGDALRVQLDVLSDLLGGDRYDLEKIEVTYTYPGPDEVALENFHTAYSAYKAIAGFKTEVVYGIWQKVRGGQQFPDTALINRAKLIVGSLCLNLLGLEKNLFTQTKSFFSVLKDIQELTDLLYVPLDFLYFMLAWNEIEYTSNETVANACDEAATACAALARTYQELAFNGVDDICSDSETTKLLAAIEQAKGKLFDLQLVLAGVRNDLWWVGNIMHVDLANQAKVALKTLSPFMEYDPDTWAQLENSYIPNLINDLEEQKNQCVTVTVAAGAHGTVVPGTICVRAGGSITFCATPDSGYVVDKWYVNGQSQPGSEGLESFTLYNIQQPTSILVTFKSAPPAGSITVTAPTAGQYARSQTMHIGWNAPNVQGNVKIELYKGSIFCLLIEDSILASYGMESWHIPSDLEPGNDYRIKISALSSTEVGYSSYFEVIQVVDNGTPIPIHDVQELQKIASEQVVDGRVFSRNGYYILANNINASGFNFVPIGTESTYFRGTLDGQGFTITGLKIDLESQEYVGLFCYTGDKTVIKNLIFSGGYIRGKSNVGVIAGDFSGMLINCHSSAAVWGTKLQSSYNIGGLVGCNYKGEIRNCSTFGPATIRGYGDKAGGIAGENDRGKIYWCWSTATDVRVYDTGTDSTVYDVGGIAGENYGEIVECYSNVSSNIRSSDYYAGGIAGDNDSTGLIRNCYSNSTTDGDYIGGIAANTEGSVTNSYATGYVSSSKGGGLFADYSGEANNCFWDTQTTGKVACTYYGTCPATCYGKSTAEMRQISTFNSAGWDFSNVWDINEGVDYPRLRGAKPCLSPPTGVTASDDQANRITIEFDTVADADVFKVYRADSTDGLFNPITDWLPITNPYEDTSVIPNVAYFYKVKVAYTINGAGESEFSNYDEGICTFKLFSPANVSATDNLLDFVLVQWDPVAGAGYYRVYRCESELGTKTAVTGWTDSLSFVDSNVEWGHAYYYWVTAAADNNGTGESEFGGPAIGAIANPDITLDGKVDFRDFAKFSEFLFEFCSEPGWCEGADLDWSGYVDFEDLQLMAEHWLEGADFNRAPVLASIGNKSINENSLLSFTISAIDADNDTITYSAHDLPSGATFSAQTFSWIPGYTQAGIYHVTFIASDGQDQDSETITITVNDVGGEPVR